MKICVVVVTFNRKDLLCDCIRRLLNQSNLITKIVIVDNAGSDGSYEYLRYKGVLPNKNIVWFRLDENMGGAGGFHYGIKYALNNDYDYVWLMDDDGYPLKDCLRQLVSAASDTVVVGPAVIDTENNNEAFLSFTYRFPHSTKVIERYSEFRAYFPVLCKGILFPFNGTLIPLNIVRKVGLPKKEYFIWGDETEYILRIKRYGFHVETITQATFYHPKQKYSCVPMFFGLLRYNEPGSDLKLYCFVRNTLKNYSTYVSKIYAALFLLKICWYNLITKFSWRKFKIVCQATFDCLKNDFTKHTMFL